MNFSEGRQGGCGRTPLNPPLRRAGGWQGPRHGEVCTAHQMLNAALLRCSSFLSAPPARSVHAKRGPWNGTVSVCLSVPARAHSGRPAAAGLLLRARREMSVDACSSEQCRVVSVRRWRGVAVSGVRRMNEVNARRARLVPGWVTVFGRVYHLGM